MLHRWKIYPIAFRENIYYFFANYAIYDKDISTHSLHYPNVIRACLETSAFIVTRRHVDKKRLCAAAKTREDCQTVPQRSDGQRMGACTSSPAPCFRRRSEAQNRPAWDHQCVALSHTLWMFVEDAPARIRAVANCLLVVSTTDEAGLTHQTSVGL